MPGTPERVRFVQELLRRLREDPAVLAAAAGSYVPATGSPTSAYAVEGEAYAAEKDYPVAHVASVSTGFFDRFGAGVCAAGTSSPWTCPAACPWCWSTSPSPARAGRGRTRSAAASGSR